jgi:uncharacterized protein YycO
MIALYRGISTISKIIRWRTRSVYSHAAWLCDDGSVIEAWTNGVRKTKNLSADHTPGTIVDIFSIDGITPEQIGEIEGFLGKHLGMPYDYRSVWRFMSLSPATINGKWFCSELIDAACTQAGAHLTRRIESHLVSPRDIGISPVLLAERQHRTYAGE